jgi:uncharacterized membrane protein
MNKSEFLRRLEEDMSSFSEEERMEALKYYDEYFTDAETEEIAAAFDDQPESETIEPPLFIEAKKEEPKKEESRNRNNNNTLKIVLAICTIPVWLPLLIALGSVAFGLFMTLFGLAFAVAGVALAGFIAIGAGFMTVGYGAVNIFIDVSAALYPIGAGLLGIGAGIIIACVFTKLTVLMFKSQVKFASWTIGGIARKITNNN